jgi:hypothetical protein
MPPENKTFTKLICGGDRLKDKISLVQISARQIFEEQTLAMPNWRGQIL